MKYNELERKELVYQKQEQNMMALKRIHNNKHQKDVEVEKWRKQLQRKSRSVNKKLNERKSLLEQRLQVKREMHELKKID